MTILEKITESMSHEEQGYTFTIKLLLEGDYN
jgi:hypothetical protein